MIKPYFNILLCLRPKVKLISQSIVKCLSLFYLFILQICCITTSVNNKQVRRDVKYYIYLRSQQNKCAFQLSHII